MKFYQIIYNSSQTTRDGGVGFGIRSITSDLPEDYLTSIVDSELLTPYDSGNYPTIYPKDLIADLSLITQYPVNYQYSTLVTKGGKKLWVCKRCVPVGFDYAYYMNGKATRLGNYVTHLVIFDEEPDVSAFDLFYDEPAQNAQYFIPVHRIPEADCQELKTLMVDKMPDLPAAFPFECKSTHQLDPSPEVYHILFHYLKAKKEGKKLIIKIKDEGKNIIIGNLYRIMGKRASEVTFQCVTYEQSFPDGIELTFVNQYYPFTLPEQHPSLTVVDATDAPSTEEYEKYTPQLQEAIASGDMEEVHKVSEWLISEDYLIVKGKDQNTSRSIYNYCTTPEKFTISDLNNDEVVELIVKKGGTYSLVYDRINTLIAQVLASDSSSNLAKVIMRLSILEKMGLDISPVLKRNIPQISAFMTRDPGTLAEIFGIIGKKLFARFVQKTDFNGKTDFLTDERLLPLALDLYKYFIEDPSGNMKDVVMIYAHKLSSAKMLNLLRDAQPSLETRTQQLLMMLLAQPQEVAYFWELILADNSQKTINVNLFSSVFKSHLNDETFHDIFYYGFKNQILQRKVTALEALKFMTDLMTRNTGFAEDIRTKGKEDKIFGWFYTKMQDEVTISKRKIYAGHIENEILPVTGSSQKEWVNLCALLNNTYDSSAFKQIYQIAAEIHDKSFFKEIAYKTLDTTRSPNTRTVIKDLNRNGCLEESEFLKHIDAYGKTKKCDCLGAYCLLQEMSFKQALEFLQECDVQDVEAILEVDYPKAWKSRKRKQAFINSIKNLFTSKQPKEKKSPEPRTKKK